MLAIDEKHHITLTQSGDTEAFSPLVRKYQSRIYTHIHGRVRDTETAKDLTQEVWLKAYRGIKGFRADTALSSWLYRIAENVCIDYFRKQKKGYDSVPLYEIDERHITDTHPCSSRYLERQELREHLHTAIAALTPIRKQVFLLYYIQEHPIKQIAERLNKSEGTIKTHLRNARLQLQELLKAYVQNEPL